jgi:hypothetical protein
MFMGITFTLLPAAGIAPGGARRAFKNLPKPIFFGLVEVESVAGALLAVGVVVVVAVAGAVMLAVAGIVMLAGVALAGVVVTVVGFGAALVVVE